MNKVLRGNIYFLIIILVALVGPYITSPIARVIGINNIGFMLMFNHFTLFIVPAIIYMIVTKSNFKKTFRLNKLSWSNIGFTILLAILAQPIMNLCALVSSYFFPNNVAEFVGQINYMPYWQMLLIMAVTPAITEEVTMRGVILSNYDEVSPIKAAIITGILFGIFHMSPQQFLYATLLGILMAYLVRITNSIFSAVLLHFLINGWTVTLQKLITKISETFNLENAVDQAADTTLQLGDLISMAALLIPFAIGAGALIWCILRHMNNKQKSIIASQTVLGVSEDSANKTQFKDSIVNYIPIFISLVLYFGFVALDMYVRSIQK